MENTKRNNKVWIILVVIAAIAGVYFLYKWNVGGKLKIPFPFTQNVSDRTTLACEALLDMDVTGSPVEYLTNGIEASVEKGTNKVSLAVKDDKTISFLSGASFNAGNVDRIDFDIVKNDDNELVAAMYNDTSMNSIVLNKKNGLAIWSKTRYDFPTYDAPSGNLSYLLCK